MTWRALTSALLALALVTGHGSLVSSVWADEFEVKEDLTVSGTGGTLKNPNLEVQGNVGIMKDLYLHEGMVAAPYGGLGRYENLLKHSEEFDDATSGATWTKTNLTVTANATEGPEGTTTAETLTVAGVSPGSISQTVPTTVTLPYTVSVWAKADTATTVTLELTTDGTGATTQTMSAPLTSDWKRYSLSKSAGAGATPTAVIATIKTTGAVGETLHVWGAQLEQHNPPGVYVKTTTDPVAAARGLTANSAHIFGDLEIHGQLLQHGGASGQTLTGTLTFSNVPTDLTTGPNEHLALMPNGTGNVGIGTTAPTQKLEVVGTVKATSFDGALNTAGNLTSSGNLQISGPGPHYLSNGNVGIGTTAPGQKLHVKGTTTDSSAHSLYVENANGRVLIRARNDEKVMIGNVTGAEQLDVEGGIRSAGGNVIAAGATSYVAASRHYFSGTALNKYVDNAKLLTADAADFTFDLAGNATMTVGRELANASITLTPKGTGNVLISSGNVGIGTTSPSFKLSLSDGTGFMHLNPTGWAQEFRTNGIGPWLFMNSEVRLDAVGGVAKIGSQGATTPFVLAIDGSEKMRVDTSGNVGIGTTGPLGKLNVYEGAYTSGLTTYTNGGEGLVVNARVDNTANYLATVDFVGLRASDGTNGGSQFRFWTQPRSGGAPDVRMLIDRDGNVGIGTATPGARLQVLGGDVLIGNPTIHDTTPDEDLLIKGNLVVDGQIVQHLGGANAFDALTVSGDTFLATTSGNVGIGTTSPSSKLDVAGNATGFVKTTIHHTAAGTGNGAQLSIGMDNDPDNLYMQAFSSAYTTLGMNVAAGAVINGEGPGGLSVAATQAPIRFYTNGSAVGNERMRIDAGGNVGIGTASPATKLEVAGGALTLDSTTNYFLERGASNVFRFCGPNASCATASSLVAGRLQLSADGSFANAQSLDPGMGGIRAPGNAWLATTSGANVGIGTTSPSHPLTVVGSGPVVGLKASGQWSGIEYLDTAGAVAAYIGQDNVGNNLRLNAHATDSFIRFLTQGNEWMRIASDGNVGIGTPAPDAKLTVYDSGTNGIHLNAVNIPVMRFQVAGANKWGFLGNYGSTNGLSIYNYTADNVLMELTSGGNVGIGTSSPANKLQIGSVGSTGYGGNDFVVGNGNQVFAIYMNPTAGQPQLYTNTNFAFLPSGAGATGNVGIGTSDPQAKLHVAGNVALRRADKVIMDQDAGAGTYLTKTAANVMEWYVDGKLVASMRSK